MKKFPATSNLASTLAGIEDLLCLRYDTSAGSLYTELVTNGTLVVKRSFVNADGSSMFTGTGTIPDTTPHLHGQRQVRCLLLAD